MSKSKLTPKQEAFFQAYLETSNSTTAYEMAYDTSKMTRRAVEVEGKKLLKHPAITLRLDNLNQKQEVKTLLSLEDHMERLRLLSEKAENDGKFSAAIQAEVKRGELRRFYIKQVETGGPNEFDSMSDEELADFIRTEAAEVLPQLDARRAAASRTRH